MFSFSSSVSNVSGCQYSNSMRLPALCKLWNSVLRTWNIFLPPGYPAPTAKYSSHCSCVYDRQASKPRELTPGLRQSLSSPCLRQLRELRGRLFHLESCLREDNSSPSSLMTGYPLQSNRCIGF